MAGAEPEERVVTEEIEELRAEVRELRGLLEAHGNQLAHIRRVIAGGDSGFWNIDDPEDGSSLLARIEVIDGKMDGFAMGLQSVKREQAGEDPSP